MNRIRKRAQNYWAQTGTQRQGLSIVAHDAYQAHGVVYLDGWHALEAWYSEYRGVAQPYRD
jgi:hypothetical protein